MAEDATSQAARSGGQLVLLTLAAGQFLMTLDSSVMNVSIATVAEDVGTTVTGIQSAITAYTLVMATLMITGGKVGAMIGRKRAFAIGCVIYGCGSFTTALAPNLPGAAVRLVVPRGRRRGADPARDRRARRRRTSLTERRPAAYGLVAAAGAIAVAAGPLIGGFCTTYFSWRWVFAGEVVVVAGDPAAAPARSPTRRSETRPRLDLVGAVLSALGLGLARLRRAALGRVGLDSAEAGRRRRGPACRRPSG